LATVGKSIKPSASERRQAILSSESGTLIYNRLIDKIGINKRFGNRRPAFDQHPRDAATSQSLQSTFRTDHTLVVERNREDLRRFRAQ
jgi:hypothetical protein